MQILIRHLITDKDWGDVVIFRPTPRDGDPWGKLSPLKGTVWEPYIYTVTGEAFSHALHGWATPLMNELGPPPLKIAFKKSITDSYCGLIKSCITAEGKCHAAGPPPACYEAPLEEPAKSIAEKVVRAWADGGWVVVVTDGEFSLS